MSEQENKTTEEKVGIGGYIALVFAIVFFSGVCAGNHWWGIFDFSTLNGAFGKVITNLNGDVLKTSTGMFRGVGGSGAIDGFCFALTLVPTVMFALAMITVCDHYGALAAARQLLTPILRPLMGIPGSCSLALIASLQSTDGGVVLLSLTDSAGNTVPASIALCLGIMLVMKVFGANVIRFLKIFSAKKKKAA